MHHFQTNYSILQDAIVGIIFVITLFIRITLGRCGNFVSLHHVNAFIVEDNILWHKVDTSLTTLAAMIIGPRDAR